jgi:hypothetical protein
MTGLDAEFNANAYDQKNYRNNCTMQLGRNEFAHLFAGSTDLSVNRGTDKLPYAAIIWNKATDLFAVTFADEDEHLLHRLRVHFFHEGHEPIKDSGAFLPVGKVFEACPRLVGKDLTFSRRGGDRIIDGLTHAQLNAILKCATLVNHGEKLIHDFRAGISDQVKRTVDNNFSNRQPLAQEPKVA